MFTLWLIVVKWENENRVFFHLVSETNATIAIIITLLQDSRFRRWIFFIIQPILVEAKNALQACTNILYNSDFITRM